MSRSRFATLSFEDILLEQKLTPQEVAIVQKRVAAMNARNAATQKEQRAQTEALTRERWELTTKQNDLEWLRNAYSEKAKEFAELQKKDLTRRRDGLKEELRTLEGAQRSLSDTHYRQLAPPELIEAQLRAVRDGSVVSSRVTRAWENGERVELVIDSCTDGLLYATSLPQSFLSAL